VARVLEELDGEQERLAQALGVFELARELGTTVLAGAWLRGRPSLRVSQSLHAANLR